MADTVVVVESAHTPQTPATPPSAPTPETPSDAVVEMVHDDARDLGFALARITEHDAAIAEIRAEIALLAGNDAAQAQAVSAIVDDVETIAEVVEDIEPGNQVPDDVEPEPEDTEPGKTHWLRRSAREWVGR